MLDLTMYFPIWSFQTTVNVHWLLILRSLRPSSPRLFGRFFCVTPNLNSVSPTTSFHLLSSFGLSDSTILLLPQSTLDSAIASSNKQNARLATDVFKVLSLNSPTKRVAAPSQKNKLHEFAELPYIYIPPTTLQHWCSRSTSALCSFATSALSSQLMIFTYESFAHGFSPQPDIIQHPHPHTFA